MILRYKRGDFMTELTSLRNIGKEIAKKLKAIGIHSPEELKQTGSKEALFRLNNPIQTYGTNWK